MFLTLSFKVLHVFTVYLTIEACLCCSTTLLFARLFFRGTSVGKCVKKNLSQDVAAGVSVIWLIADRLPSVNSCLQPK